MRNEFSIIESAQLDHVVGGAGKDEVIVGAEIPGKGKGGVIVKRKWNDYQTCADDPKRKESISICQPLHNKGQ